MFRKKDNDWFSQISDKSTKVTSLNDIFTNGDNESYIYKSRVEQLLNTKVQPNKNDTILQDFIRFLVLRVTKITLDI